MHYIHTFNIYSFLNQKFSNLFEMSLASLCLVNYEITPKQWLCFILNKAIYKTIDMNSKLNWL